MYYQMISIMIIILLVNTLKSMTKKIPQNKFSEYISLPSLYSFISCKYNINDRHWRRQHLGVPTLTRSHQQLSSQVNVKCILIPQTSPM